MRDADDIRARIAALRRRSADARQRAGSAAAAAAHLEEQAALRSAPLAEPCARMAALQRRVQERHLISARVQDRYADRLCDWLGRAGEPERPPAFVDAVAASMGMHSVTVLLLGTRQDEVMIAATDTIGRAAYDLEFVLGEGPARSAVAHGHAVQVPDLTRCDRWPRYGAEAVKLGVRAVLAVPVQPAAPLGAVCGYGSEPAIGQDAVTAAGAIADALPQILWHVVKDREPGDDDSMLTLFGDADFPAAIYQAAGMVSRQCGCGIDDALALLRARAFCAGRPAGEVAGDVLRGELRLC